MDKHSRSQTAMESVWPVSKLSTKSESVCSRRELVANCVHTADATQLGSFVASAVCIGHSVNRCILHDGIISYDILSSLYTVHLHARPARVSSVWPPSSPRCCRHASTGRPCDDNIIFTNRLKNRESIGYLNYDGIYDMCPSSGVRPGSRGHAACTPIPSTEKSYRGKSKTSTSLLTDQELADGVHDPRSTRRWTGVDSLRYSGASIPIYRWRQMRHGQFGGNEQKV